MKKMKCRKCDGTGLSTAAAQLNVDYAEQIRSFDRLDEEDISALLWAGRLDPADIELNVPDGMFCLIPWPLICARLKKSGLSPYCSNCRGSGSILIGAKREKKKKHRFQSIKHITRLM